MVYSSNDYDSKQTAYAYIVTLLQTSWQVGITKLQKEEIDVKMI